MRNVLSYLLIVLAFSAMSLFAEDGRENTPPDASNQLSGFLKEYKVNAYTGIFKPSSYATTYCTWEYLAEKDQAELKRYAKIFIDEWKKYPKDWVEKSHIEAVAFVRNLKVQGVARAAMPDAYGEVLYLDIGYLGSGENYVRYVVHHEYYHMIEENYFHDMYYKDPAWSQLNPPDFRYGPGGAAAYSDGYRAKDHPRTGFVTQYATSGLEEDKADVYAYLMVAPYNKQLLLWAISDAILSKKINYLMRFIAAHSASMNRDYFLRMGKAE